MLCRRGVKLGLGLGEKGYSYGNGADWQTGMLLPIPNLSKFKQLVWPKFMLPIGFFLTDRILLAISLLEKLIAAKI